MAALNFPQNPTPGDHWGRWYWDGVKWTFPPSRPGAEPPIGEIIDWPSDIEPDPGWLVLDGRSASRRANHVLFGMIGERFGSAPRGHLFQLPDLRGKLLVGLDPDDTGRITIMDVARLWEEGGSLLVAEHTHPGASGGTHAHGIADGTHIHGVTQAGVHGHGWHDPHHAHATYQDPHSHALSDPTHTHGKPDPMHSHLQGHHQDGRRAPNRWDWFVWANFGAVGTTHDGVGVWNDAAGTGVNCLGDNAWIWVDAAGTGYWTAGANVPIDNYAAHTGVTMQTGVTGITETALNDGIDNMQPVLEMTKLVRARGISAVPAIAPVTSPVVFPVNPPIGTVYRAWLWDGIKWDRIPHGLSPSGVRIGTIIDWCDWPDTPPYYMIADGRELSRAGHPRLFLIYGTTHGDGDGLTTFNLPDTRARVTVGLDAGTVTGRLTVTISGIDAGLVGAVGGDERLGSHTHPSVAYDPGHAHGLNDPTHNHGVWQDAHNHGLHGGDHAHGFPQNHHGHGQSAGHHNHGWQGGHHGHSQIHGWYNDQGWIDWIEYWAVVWGNFWISNAHTGVGNHGAGIGVWTGGNYAWISVNGGGGGQWIDGNWGDFGFHWGGTNVTAHNADAASGLVIEANDGGDTGNIAPSLVLPKLIYAGVDYDT